MAGQGQEDLPPCLITIDTDGRWYHKGAEIIHREIVRLFYASMSLDAEGRYVIDWQGQRCFVEPADTAYVVRRVDCSSGPGEDANGILLTLSDDSRESLVPETLLVGGDNVLYCRVKDGIFPARFTRPAYYQIAQYIEEDGGRFFLVRDGQKYPVAVSPMDTKSS